MNNIKLVLVSLLCVVGYFSQAQDFPKPKNGRQIHDFANVIPDAQEKQLEESMQAFRRANGAEIAVIIISSLEGYDVAQYNIELAEKWGIGKSGEDNGVSFLVAIDDRNMNISTGYGVEQYIPDALAKRIIEQVVKPEFKEENYYAGIAKGVDAIQGLIEGKYSAEDFKSSRNRGLPWIWIPIIILILIAKSKRKGGGFTGGSGGAYWIGGMGMGGFSSGRGSSGGGFGGFGGGSFGGGGASGSW